MTDAQRVSPRTLVRIAAELVGTPVTDGDLRAVAALLSGLTSEMGSMRAMELTDAEPATTYDPSQP